MMIQPPLHAAVSVCPLWQPTVSTVGCLHRCTLRHALILVLSFTVSLGYTHSTASHDHQLSGAACRFNWVEEAARAKALVAAGELVLEEEPCLHSTGPSAASDALLSASAPHGCFVAGGFASMEVHHHSETCLPGLTQQKQQYAAQGASDQQSWEGSVRGSKGNSRTTSRSDKHQVQHGRQSPLDHRLQVS